MQSVSRRRRPADGFEDYRNHPSLVERIAEDLTAAIADGRLRPGDRVIEAELCQRMGVSRSPLREAFRILENQRFLVREPRRGMRVASFTIEEAEEIYRIRAALESLAAFLAVKRGDPAVLAELRRLHRGMVAAGEGRDDHAYRRLNRRFHQVLTEASGSPRLVGLVGTLFAQVNRYRFKVFSVRGKTEESIRNHAELIAFFERGDPEGAERSRREAILKNIDSLHRHFGEDGG